MGGVGSMDSEDVTVRIQQKARSANSLLPSQHLTVDSVLERSQLCWLPREQMHVEHVVKYAFSNNENV